MNIEKLKRTKHDIEDTQKYTLIGKVLWFTSLVSIILLIVGFIMFFTALNTPTSTSHWDFNAKPTSIWSDDYINQITPKKTTSSSTTLGVVLMIIGLMGMCVYAIGEIITSSMVLITYGTIDKKYVKGFKNIGPILVIVGHWIWFLSPFGLFSIGSELKRALTAVEEDISKLESAGNSETELTE